MEALEGSVGVCVADMLVAARRVADVVMRCIVVGLGLGLGLGCLVGEGIWRAGCVCGLIGRCGEGVFIVGAIRAACSLPMCSLMFFLLNACSCVRRSIRR